MLFSFAIIKKINRDMHDSPALNRIVRAVEISRKEHHLSTPYHLIGLSNYRLCDCERIFFDSKPKRGGDKSNHLSVRDALVRDHARQRDLFQQISPKLLRPLHSHSVFCRDVACSYYLILSNFFVCIHFKTRIHNFIPDFQFVRSAHGLSLPI